MNWIALLALVAVLAALPSLLERRRRHVANVREAALANPPDVAPGGVAEVGKAVQLSDGMTHYVWHGKPTDSVIVLIHGLTTPSWVFGGLVRGLTMMGYQVLTYDLFGRGLSDRPRQPQSPQFFLRQLTELLDALGLEGPVSLMGYSMGGMVASLFAGTYPDRVDRLILLAPGGMGYTPGEPLRTAGLSGPLGNWLWGLVGGHSIVRAARKDTWGPTVISDLETRMRAEVGKRGYLRSVLRAHRETLAIDFEDIHRDIAQTTTIPVLAIWGETDAIIPASAMGKLTQWNRNVRHHVAPGVGHGLPHMAPKEILSAITAFLKEPRPDPRALVDPTLAPEADRPL